MPPIAFCPIHGLFPADKIKLGLGSSLTVLGSTYSCPICGRQSEILPGTYSALQDRLNVLIDPSISREALLALRQIAESLRSGMLTPVEAANAAYRISPKFSNILAFLNWPPEAQAQIIAALILVVGAILTARSTSAPITIVTNQPVIERVIEKVPAAEKPQKNRVPKPKRKPSKKRRKS